MFISSVESAEPFTCAGIQFGMLLPRDITDSVEVVWEKLRADQSTPVDRHATFDQLFFLLKGQGEVMIGDQTTIVGPQALIFIPRNTDHSIRPISEEGLEYLYFNVWGKGVPEKEKGWQRAYSQIHDRRVEESKTVCL